MIDQAYVTQLLQELVRINSVNPPGNEKVIAEYVDALLRDIGITSNVDYISDTRANAIGFLVGNTESPVLVLNGHLDTVPVKEDWDHSPFSGEMEEGRIYGLGAADMKGSIASMIAAAKSIKESTEELRGSILLSFVADEERKNAGILHFLEKYNSIDYAVIGEPSSLSLVTSNRGVMRFKIKTFGRAGHASNPAQGENAIYKMNKVISKFRDLADGYTACQKNYADKPSLSVTMIHGGTGENIIPDRCEILIDRRIVPNEKADNVTNEIVEMLKEIQKRDRDFRYTCETITAVNAWKVNDDSKLLQYGVQAYRKCFQNEPVFRDLGATCEANFFADKGIDTFVFGAGNIENAHTKDEYVEVDQLVKAAQYYDMLIREVLMK